MKFKLLVVKGNDPPAFLTLSADSEASARLHASRLGLTVLSLSSHASGLSGGSVSQSTRRARLRPADLTLLIEQLLALLQAGLSVIEALDTLDRSNRGAVGHIVSELSGKLKQGLTLSRSMASDEMGFPALLIAMVRSAEVTSDLPQALARYLDHEKRAAQVRHQVVSVALYPSLLLAVGGGVMLFLLLYVMPRFARIFEGMSTLPWSAQMMVAWSRILHAHGWLMAGVALAALLGLGAALGVPRYRARLLQIVLSLRPLARQLNTYFLARWYRTIGMLVEGGIPLPESVQLANHVLPLALHGNGQDVESAMREGISPSESFVQAGMATAVAAQLIRAGERSGDVGLMLSRSADYHEREVTRQLENAMKVIEPLVMTFIGIGVGVVVVLMYLPIFELASAIQ